MIVSKFMNIFNLFYFVFDTYIDTDFALFLKFYISKFTVSKTTVYFISPDIGIDIDIITIIYQESLSEGTPFDRLSLEHLFY